jgi:hypothetical protein
MSERTCRCGLVAASPGELTDHLFEVFLPADDMGTDGRAHAERFPSGADGSVWECLCGFTTIEMAAFDAHLLAAFTPANGIGRDGQPHERQPGDEHRHDGYPEEFSSHEDFLRLSP